MKKPSFVALALFAGLAVFAQEPKLRTDMAVKPYFGIKAGVNLASFNLSNTTLEATHKTTFQGGFLANIPLGTGKVAFQPELLYLSAGAHLNVPGNSTTSNNVYEQDLHYIALPLMLQVRPTRSFFIEAGPQASYLIRARRQETNNTESDNKAELDKFDVAVNGGLGFVTRVGVGASARYSYGLRNIMESSNNTGNMSMKNTGIQFSLFYLIGANR